MKISKRLLLLVGMLPIFCVFTMEISIRQEEEKRLEALCLELPKYPIHTNPTNYKEALENINKLMGSFKPIKENSAAFSFLKFLKKEYNSLNKQKAILIKKFDLSSQQKELILEQEKTRLTQLEQQLVEKSNTLNQLTEKVKVDTKQVQDKSLKIDGILNENREIKLQLQNVTQQNEQYTAHLKSINDSLNEVQEIKQKLEKEQLEFKSELKKLRQEHEDIKLENVQKSTVKFFWQHKEFYYGCAAGIATTIGLIRFWFRPSQNS